MIHTTTYSHSYQKELDAHSKKIHAVELERRKSLSQGKKDKIRISDSLEDGDEKVPGTEYSGRAVHFDRFEIERHSEKDRLRGKDGVYITTYSVFMTVITIVFAFALSDALSRYFNVFQAVSNEVASAQTIVNSIRSIRGTLEALNGTTQATIQQVLDSLTAYQAALLQYVKCLVCYEFPWIRKGKYREVKIYPCRGIDFASPSSSYAAPSYSILNDTPYLHCSKEKGTRCEKGKCYKYLSEPRTEEAYNQLWDAFGVISANLTTCTQTVLSPDIASNHFTLFLKQMETLGIQRRNRLDLAGYSETYLFWGLIISCLVGVVVFPFLLTVGGRFGTERILMSAIPAFFAFFIALLIYQYGKPYKGLIHIDEIKTWGAFLAENDPSNVYL